MLWVLIRIASRGDSNEYPQHMFLWRTDENYPSIIIKYPPYLSFSYWAAVELDASSPASVTLRRSYVVEQIRWIFGDNYGIILLISPQKHML